MKKEEHRFCRGVPLFMCYSVVGCRADSAFIKPDLHYKAARIILWLAVCQLRRQEQKMEHAAAVREFTANWDMEQPSQSFFQ